MKNDSQKILAASNIPRSVTMNKELWRQIMFNSGEYSEPKPTVTDYMKALKRAIGKWEKPVYNSALKEALKKPSWW